jgi:hypothetical protein
VNALTFAFPISASQYDGYLADEEPFNNFETLNAVQRAAAATTSSISAAPSTRRTWRTAATVPTRSGCSAIMS